MARSKEKKKNRARNPPIKKEALLDIFSEEDIERWTHNVVSASQCANAVHFDLERQRVNNRVALLTALQSVEPITIKLENWVRVVDWQWSLQPLSMVGSMRGIGGRFSYGSELTVVRRQEFPCLYLAADKTTAYCERFGGQPEKKLAGLSRQEYALRKANISFATFDVNGIVNQVFDLRDKRNLKRFAQIISSFSWNESTRKLHANLGFSLPSLIRDVEQLRRRILAPPELWRQAGNAFGIPAPSQIFGWFLREAGFEAVIYPSQQGGDVCLAIFPENLKDSESFIEVTGPSPEGATCMRLDRNNLLLPPR